MSKNNEHDPTTQRRCMWCTEEEREKLVAEGGEPYGTSCDILDYVSDNHCERHRIEAEQEYARWQERRVAQMSRHVEGSTHVVLHRPNGSEYHVTIEGFRDVEWWVEHLSGKGWITEQDLQKVRDAR